MQQLQTIIHLLVAVVMLLPAVAHTPDKNNLLGRSCRAGGDRKPPEPVLETIGSNSTLAAVWSEYRSPGTTPDVESYTGHAFYLDGTTERRRFTSPQQ
jgi:hypothetical protein